MLRFYLCGGNGRCKKTQAEGMENAFSLSLPGGPQAVRAAGPRPGPFAEPGRLMRGWPQRRVSGPLRV